MKYSTPTSITFQRRSTAGSHILGMDELRVICTSNPDFDKAPKKIEQMQFVQEHHKDKVFVEKINQYLTKEKEPERSKV